MSVIEKEVFICQWTKKTGQGLEEMQGGNINAFRPQSD